MKTCEKCGCLTDLKPFALVADKVCVCPCVLPVSATILTENYVDWQCLTCFKVYSPHIKKCLECNSTL